MDDFRSQNNTDNNHGQPATFMSMEGVPSVARPCGAFVQDLKKSFLESDKIPYDIPLLECILDAAGLTELYRHQELVLERILKRITPANVDDLAQCDTLLATAVGSGRSTVAYIACCYRVLAYAENTLLLAPNTVTAKRTSEKIKNIIEFLGFSYAIQVNCLNEEAPNKPQGISEIVVATPAQLARLFEENRNEQVPPEFFSFVSLIIMEDIHEYTGIYGSNVAALMRCINLLLARHANYPIILATGMPYANITAFTQSLVNRRFSQQGGILTEDRAGSTSKKLCLLNLDGSADHSLSKQVNSLISSFVKTENGRMKNAKRTFCFLFDISAISSVDFVQSIQTIQDDLKRAPSEDGFRNGDNIELYACDQKLGVPIAKINIGGHQEVLDDKFDLQKLIAGKKRPLQDLGTISPVDALLELLEQKRSCSDTFERLVIFVYSSFDEEIPASISSEFRKHYEKLSFERHVAIDLYYISLGLEPHVSLRTMVNRVGGRCEEINQQVTDKSTIKPPTKIWVEDNVQNRPIVVFCQNDLIAVEDVVNFPGIPSHILLYPRYTFPGIEDEVFRPQEKYIASPEDLLRCQCMIIVGWNGSPPLLNHHLRHIGKNDAAVCILNTPSPLACVSPEEWTSSITAVPQDRLNCNPYAFNTGLRAVRYMSRYESLSYDEANYIAYGKWKTDATARHLMKRLEHYEEIELFNDAILTKKVGGASTSSLWKSFHVAANPLKLKNSGIASEEAWFIDETALLRDVPVSGSIVLNGNLQNVKQIYEDELEIEPTHQHVYAFPDYNTLIEELATQESQFQSISELGDARLEKVTVNIQATLNGTIICKSAIAGSTTTKRTNERSIHFSVPGVKLILNHSIQPGGLLALENMLWFFLNSFVHSERRTVITHCVPEKNLIYLFDGTFDGNGLDSLLMDDPSFFSYILETGIHALARCQCTTGCIKCLEMPSKTSVKEEHKICKKAIIEFICKVSKEYQPLFKSFVDR
jgi:hypothetical protein